MEQIDLAAYGIEWSIDASGSCVATIPTLPGCVAVGRTMRELTVALEQAIWLYLDEHDEAPRHVRPA